MQQNIVQDPSPPLSWHHDQDDEPDPSKLCYLLTTTGLLVIGYYPPTNQLEDPNAHYVAWAPLSEQPIVLH